MMTVRLARCEDLPALQALYDGARRFMAQNGNPEQWKTGGPTRAALEQDIRRGESYVCEEDGTLCAAFMFRAPVAEGETEPDYACINGAWAAPGPYGVMHRVAVATQGKGVVGFCIDWCFAKCGNLRMDTHRDNRPMRRALTKNGFVYCGVIRLGFDGSERLAYQKLK
ncbi:N-acetyltransferase family protein [uncultured Ruthenibacterium sp.]|uniref:GNAT family N-acetyltransferase n=1 Tax=uncultured Ruthenibacterium sp. TaxID=1905347 RepID=UPI00349EBE99